jgi:transposase
MKNSNENIREGKVIKFNEPLDTRTKLSIVEALNDKKSQRQIAKELHVSKSSVQRIQTKVEHKEDIKIKIPNRRCNNNPNSKVTQNYIDLILKSITEFQEYILKQRSKYLNSKTNIKISELQLLQLLKKHKITKKNFSTKYYESITPINQNRKKIISRTSLSKV